MPEPIIVHVTADFGDPLVPSKTKAVPQLIAGTPGYRHIVYSLNRVSWRSGVAALEFEPDRIALAYGAPPKGLLLETRLTPVSEWITADLKAKGLVPDLVHAHKLTVDGLVALPVARAFGAPLVASSWGDTDLRIMNVRRDLRARWREIVGECRAVLPITPWLRDTLVETTGLDPAKAHVLPAITATERWSPSAPAGPRLVSVFHLDSHRRKGADSLIRAVAELSREIPDLTLDIYGRGAPQAFLDLSRLIAESEARERVTLKGPVAHEKVHGLLGSYGAFVLPSRRESYGMVFVEALFAGIPILHPRGWGVDRLFADEMVGYACDASDLGDIKAGIRVLVRDEAVYKARIAEGHRRGAFDHVTREAILAKYDSVLRSVLGTDTRRPSAAPITPSDASAS